MKSINFIGEGVPKISKKRKINLPESGSRSNSKNFYALTPEIKLLKNENEIKARRKSCDNYNSVQNLISKFTESERIPLFPNSYPPVSTSAAESKNGNNDSDLNNYFNNYYRHKNEDNNESGELVINGKKFDTVKWEEKENKSADSNINNDSNNNYNDNDKKLRRRSIEKIDDSTHESNNNYYQAYTDNYEDNYNLENDDKINQTRMEIEIDVRNQSSLKRKNDGDNNDYSNRKHFMNTPSNFTNKNENFNNNADQNGYENKNEIEGTINNLGNNNENENKNENEEEIFFIPLHDVIGGMDQERNAAEKFVRTLSHALKTESKSPGKKTNSINTDLNNTDLKNTILKNESLEKFELECKIKVSERKNGKKNSFSEFLSNCAEEKNKFEFLLSLFSSKKT